MPTRLHELTDDDRKHLAKIRRVIAAFRTLDSRMPSSYIEAFLCVALDPGKGPTEYGKQMHTAQAIMSRILLEVGPKSRIKDEPLALIDRQPSPADLREQEYFLTPKGRRLLDQIAKILED